MMKLKALFHWFYKQIYDYNTFIPGENEYNDDDNEQDDPAATLKKQKYATWLYTVLLADDFSQFIQIES
ncbi:unnamed protein product [Adineta ricciae]|uniref:Uncharacterized protein n=1 Tax=Adineta ricciae TaxID=249248 RepID=A0A815LSC0_ADIRI|nr:unnamed protein product [Adineta ricciae]